MRKICVGVSGPMSLPRSSQSPGEPRNKRLRRLSSTEEEMELSAGAAGPGRGVDKSGAEVAYYGQSPASLSSQTSWHSDVDHGRFFLHSLAKNILFV